MGVQLLLRNCIIHMYTGHALWEFYIAHFFLRVFEHARIVRVRFLPVHFFHVTKVLYYGRLPSNAVNANPSRSNAAVIAISSFDIENRELQINNFIIQPMKD